MRLIVSLGVCAGLASGAMAVGGVAQPRDAASSTLLDVKAPGAFHPEHVLVRLKPKSKPDQIKRLLKSIKSRGVVHSYPAVPGLYCIKVESGTVDRAIRTLKKSSIVQYAERDLFRSALAQETPYGITMVGAESVWATGNARSAGAGVRIAVLDTGIDFGHPDLPPVIASETFISGEAVDDLHTHGTHCSGTVLALNNDIGVVGVAPQASLMIGKVLANSGSGATSGVMAGCQWAFDNKADIISMSLGGGGASQAEQDLYQAIHDGGTLVIAAAGNSNTDVPSYPGSYPSVVCVAAIDSNYQRASFSNFGPSVDISGPGVNVMSTIPNIDATVTWNESAHDGNPLSGSQLGTITGQVYSCNQGLSAADFPAAVSGNIALIRRGGATFASKVQLAAEAGAVGVVISNNAAGNFNGTLNGGSSLIVLGISQADGDELQTLDGTTVTLTNGQLGHTYASYSGTSMATPHVAGIAGLMVASRLPGHVSATKLRQALEASAQDLGDPGRDDQFGHGLARADLAILWMNQNGICPADWNDDRGVDSDDVIDFFRDWNTLDADFNRDGETDTDDVVNFFQRWDSGC
jgi:serine protease